MNLLSSNQLYNFLISDKKVENTVNTKKGDDSLNKGFYYRYGSTLYLHNDDTYYYYETTDGFVKVHRESPTSVTIASVTADAMKEAVLATDKRTAAEIYANRVYYDNKYKTATVTSTDNYTVGENTLALGKESESEASYTVMNGEQCYISGDSMCLMCTGTDVVVRWGGYSFLTGYTSSVYNSGVLFSAITGSSVDTSNYSIIMGNSSKYTSLTLGLYESTYSSIDSASTSVVLDNRYVDGDTTMNSVTAVYGSFVSLRLNDKINGFKGNPIHNVYNSVVLGNPFQPFKDSAIRNSFISMPMENLYSPRCLDQCSGSVILGNVDMYSVKNTLVLGSAYGGVGVSEWGYDKYRVSVRRANEFIDASLTIGQSNNFVGDIKKSLIVGDGNSIGYFNACYRYTMPEEFGSETYGISVFGNTNKIGFGTKYGYIYGFENYIPSESSGIGIIGNYFNMFDAYPNENKSTTFFSKYIYDYDLGGGITEGLQSSFVTADELSDILNGRVAQEKQVAVYTIIGTGSVNIPDGIKHVDSFGNESSDRVITLTGKGISAYISYNKSSKTIQNSMITEQFTHFLQYPTGQKSILNVGDNNTLYNGKNVLLFGDDLRFGPHIDVTNSVFFGSNIIMGSPAGVTIDSVMWLYGPSRGENDVMAQLDAYSLNTGDWHTDEFTKALVFSSITQPEFYGVFSSKSLASSGAFPISHESAKKPDAAMIYTDGIALGGKYKNDYGLLKIGNSFMSNTQYSTWDEWIGGADTYGPFGLETSPAFIRPGTNSCPYGGMPIAVTSTQEMDGTMHIKPFKLDERGLNIEKVGQALTQAGFGGGGGGNSVVIYNTDLTDFIKPNSNFFEVFHTDGNEPVAASIIKYIGELKTVLRTEDGITKWTTVLEDMRNTWALPEPPISATYTADWYCLEHPFKFKNATKLDIYTWHSIVCQDTNHKTGVHTMAKSFFVDYNSLKNGVIYEINFHYIQLPFPTYMTAEQFNDGKPYISGLQMIPDEVPLDESGNYYTDTSGDTISGDSQYVQFIQDCGHSKPVYCWGSKNYTDSIPISQCKVQLRAIKNEHCIYRPHKSTTVVQFDELGYATLRFVMLNNFVYVMRY